MSRFLLLTLTACVHTPREPQATLVALTTRPGLSEGAVRAVVEAHLSELESCIDFARRSERAGLFTGVGMLERIDFTPRLDDRVEVAWSRVVDGESKDWAVRAESAWADRGCVASRVHGWGLPTAQLRELDQMTANREPDVTFTYRFAPSVTQRQKVRAMNEQSFATVCEAFAGASPAVDDLPARFATVRTRVRGPLVRHFEATLDAAVKFASPEDRNAILASSMKELAEEGDLPVRCAALGGWTPWSDAELMQLPGLPATSCAERVAALAELSRQVPPVESGGLHSTRTQALREPGLFVNLSFRAQRSAVPLRPSEDELRALVATERERQGRARPVVYFGGVEDIFPGSIFIDLVLHWAQEFEVRVLTFREGPVEPRLATRAWPAAVAALRSQLVTGAAANSRRIADLLETLGDDELLCPGLANWQRFPDDPIEDVAGRVGTTLEACGCPHALTEAVFARLLVATDERRERVGWIAFDVTDDPRAPVVRVPSGVNCSELFEAVGNRHARVQFGP